MTVLDNIVSNHSTAQGVNNIGQIVGGIGGDAVIWNNLLPMNVADQSSTLSATRASDINDDGVVVGTGITISGPFEQHGFIYENNMITDLGTLGGSTSLALAINGPKKVVGFSKIGTDTTDGHAFLWDSGMIKDLGTILNTTTSLATDINDNDQIVGYSGDRSGTIRKAIIWEANKMNPLVSLGNRSYAQAINNQGQIVGWTEIGDDRSTQHACLWLNQSEIILLGSLEEGKSHNAFDINSSGTIVGYYDLAAGGNQGFVYNNGQLNDLNDLIEEDPDVLITSAIAVNDRGQIVGNAKVNGTERAVLLTPIPPVSKEVQWQYGNNASDDYCPRIIFTNGCRYRNNWNV